MRIRSVALVALALAFGACARLTGGSDGTIEHPTGPDQLVLRVETGGGLVPIEYTFRQIPDLSLYGDGRIITQGPQIEIYPGPALPNVLVTSVTEEAIQAILEAAREVDLLGRDRRYDDPSIADAPTTTFTVYANGERHVVSAYALGESQGGAGIAPGDRDARARLAEFQAKLSDLGSWLPAGWIGEQAAYEPTELRVYVRPYSAAPEQGLQELAKDWPLATPLASFGQPVADLQDTRCGTVAGEDLAKLLPEARSSNELTPWESVGKRYHLLFGPVLPDEHGC